MIKISKKSSDPDYTEKIQSTSRIWSKFNCNINGMFLDADNLGSSVSRHNCMLTDYSYFKKKNVKTVVQILEWKSVFGSGS